MPYRIAGIDVHKKMLAVVVADVEVDGDFHFDCAVLAASARKMIRELRNLGYRIELISLAPAP